MKKSPSKKHNYSGCREGSGAYTRQIIVFHQHHHEFRTPITLIIGPIERALKLSSNPQVIEQLNFVERNSKYLLSLLIS
jgi:hypothetical protein